MAFSPDGNFVVTGSDRSHGPGVEERQRRRAGAARRARRLGRTPSRSAQTERRVLTASTDGTARLWDPAVQPQLELVRRTRGPLAEAEYVGCRRSRSSLPARADRRLSCGSRRPARRRRFDGRGPVRAVAASPDGELLAIAGRTGPDSPSARRAAPELVHPDKVTSVAFAPDGTRIVTGGRRGNARIWSVDGKLLVRAQRPQGRDHRRRVQPRRQSRRDRLARQDGAHLGCRERDVATAAQRSYRRCRRPSRSAPTEASCSRRVGITMRGCGMPRPASQTQVLRRALRRGSRRIVQPRRPLDPHRRPGSCAALAARGPASRSFRTVSAATSRVSRVRSSTRASRYVLTVGHGRHRAQSRVRRLP